MLDTILKVALGFYLGRTFYLQYNRQQPLRREQEIKSSIIQFLTDNGLTAEQAKQESDSFLNQF